MASTRGTVLIIDDTDGSATMRLLDDSIPSIVRHPNDVMPADLIRAKLVLVDYKLDHWPERDRQETPSFKPQNGIALIAVLRSNVVSLKAAPTAFALNSGLLAQLSGGGDPAGREHAIARSIDLEWVFAKGTKGNGFASSVGSLADAVAKLPINWPISSKTKNKILSLLAVPSKSRWRESAIDDVDRSHPPHEILIQNSSGIALLRWLLHAILPYPTFLMDARYLACRLRIEPREFLNILNDKAGKKIRIALHDFEYRGILGEFDGPRWWRAGLEHWIWTNTRGKAFDRESIEALVRSKLSKTVEFTRLPNPVVALDEELRPSNALIDLNGAVEVKPDGWPAFADNAWIPAEASNLPAFVALVSQSEQIGS
jgi:hypothetical protein